jgi:glycosyltransferase involved in cell wall biosynthesis
MNSVCIATYNGENFIEEQINSILPQLKTDDEVIIVDDSSVDGTVFLIKKLNDPRIKLFQNEINIGVNKTFEKAIFLSCGDNIFLSDQDDIWTEDHVEVLLSAIENENSLLVSSNYICFGINEYLCKKYESKLEPSKSKKYLRNLIDIFCGSLNYFGCTMAFRKELKDIILPFPLYLESHDLWIALTANILKSNIHIKNITLKKRIHINNTSIVKRNLIKKILSRFIFLLSILEIVKRKNSNKRD